MTQNIYVTEEAGEEVNRQHVIHVCMLLMVVEWWIAVSVPPGSNFRNTRASEPVWVQCQMTTQMTQNSIICKHHPSWETCTPVEEVSTCVGWWWFYYPCKKSPRMEWECYDNGDYFLVGAADGPSLGAATGAVATWGRCHRYLPKILRVLRHLSWNWMAKTWKSLW